MSSTVDRAPLVTAEVLDRLREVVGADEVYTEPGQLVRYRDPFWVIGDDTYAGAAVVRPGSTQEVQAIVRIANEFGVPVWTLGQGRNNGYGGSSPRLAGSIQISMERLNRVLEINEKLAYAVIEPGVRFFDLHEALKAGGHELRMAVPDLGWGSVTGNALDNGIQYMPLASNHGTVAGLEVVLPDGELLRTNMGAVPGSTAWHTYKRSMGPSLDALFTQSNLGIVTRMGVWLQRTPEAYQTLILGVGKDGDLDKMVDTIRELMLDGTIQGVPSIYPAPVNGALLLDLPGPKPTVWTEDAMDACAAETGIGRWAVRGDLGGPGGPGVQVGEDQGSVEQGPRSEDQGRAGLRPGGVGLDHRADGAGARRHHGRRRGPVLLQRPRLPAVRGEDQGRRGPERCALTWPARHLAGEVPRGARPVRTPWPRDLRAVTGAGALVRRRTGRTGQGSRQPSLGAGVTPRRMACAPAAARRSPSRAAGRGVPRWTPRGG
jgi:hypothetical protein